MKWRRLRQAMPLKSWGVFGLFADYVPLLTTVYSVGFYLTFWQLSSYDLSPPTAKYSEEVSNLAALSRQEDVAYTSAERSVDRSRRATAAMHREKRNRLNEVVSLLTKEMREQADARSFTIKRLAREKQHWFAHSK